MIKRYDIESYFPESYEASRARFLSGVQLLRARWISARLESYPLKNFPDLSIDWLWAEPRLKEDLIIVSTGEHGIEGYVGSAMLKVFIDEFALRLNSGKTGLLLVHALNPWGMKNNRKVNENGVDLNRNFIFNGIFDKSINPDFSKLKDLLAPPHPVRSFLVDNFFFWGRTLKALITEGVSSLTHAALLGQYIAVDAMYYGGARHEDQTVVMMELFRKALDNYQRVIHLDMHSGYGPRDQMSLTVVPLEPRTSAELSSTFRYPLILKGDRQEFYETYGDMTAYLYELRNIEFPTKPVFSCAFEFGTFGDSSLARIRSLRAMIFESQLYRYGAEDDKTEAKVRQEFRELYFPSEPGWREKALSDGRQAFEGILSAHGILGESNEKTDSD